LDFRAMYREHRRRGCAATIGVSRRKNVIDFGVLDLDKKSRVVKYTEKPAFDYLVSMGVNVFRRDVLRHIGRNEFLGIPDLIKRLQAAEEPVHGFQNRAQWLDIGRPEDYQTAQAILSQPKASRSYLR